MLSLVMRVCMRNFFGTDIHGIPDIYLLSYIKKTLVLTYTTDLT